MCVCVYVCVHVCVGGLGGERRVFLAPSTILIILNISRSLEQIQNHCFKLAKKKKEI